VKRIGQGATCLRPCWVFHRAWYISCKRCPSRTGTPVAMNVCTVCTCVCTRQSINVKYQEWSAYVNVASYRPCSWQDSGTVTLKICELFEIESECIWHDLILSGQKISFFFGKTWVPVLLWVRNNWRSVNQWFWFGLVKPALTHQDS